jgi:hypothetical protein
MRNLILQEHISASDLQGLFPFLLRLSTARYCTKVSSAPSVEYRFKPWPDRSISPHFPSASARRRGVGFARQ